MNNTVDECTFIREHIIKFIQTTESAEALASVFALVNSFEKSFLSDNDYLVF